MCVCLNVCVFVCLKKGKSKKGSTFLCPFSFQPVQLTFLLSFVYWVDGRYIQNDTRTRGCALSLEVALGDFRYEGVKQSVVKEHGIILS